MLHIIFSASHLVLHITTGTRKKHEKFLKSKLFGKKIENLAKKKGKKREDLKCEPCIKGDLAMEPSVKVFYILGPFTHITIKAR